MWEYQSIMSIINSVNSIALIDSNLKQVYSQTIFRATLWLQSSYVYEIHASRTGCMYKWKAFVVRYNLAVFVSIARDATVMKKHRKYCQRVIFTNQQHRPFFRMVFYVHHLFKTLRVISFSLTLTVLSFSNRTLVQLNHSSPVNLILDPVFVCGLLEFSISGWSTANLRTRLLN